MANIGSVFLGDSKRLRVLSSSTPPSSPPPMSQPGVLSALPSPHSPSFAASSPSALNSKVTPKEPPPVIDPVTALELRLRLLESLVVGLDPDEKGKQDLRAQTLTKSAENVRRTVEKYVQGNDTLKRFISHYEQYERYLTPAFALGLLDEPAYESMSSSDLATYVHDMEPEIRSADTDLQEIEALLSKGVADAGKLMNYVELEPRLEALLKAQQENQDRADALERRIAGIMETHATYIDSLSELFVEWDDTLIDAENRVTRAERDKEERRRLGLE